LSLLKLAALLLCDEGRKLVAPHKTFIHGVFISLVKISGTTG